MNPLKPGAPGPTRRVPATSSLPLQMALYFNIPYSFVFFLFVTAVHIHKRITFLYDSYMRILVPILIALFVVCECTRLYQGFSGNLKERIPSLSSFLLLTVIPVAPLVLYLSFFQRQSLPIETALGIPFVVMLAVEVWSAFTTVRALIQKQTALFYSLCQQGGEAEGGSQPQPQQPSKQQPQPQASHSRAHSRFRSVGEDVFE